MMIVKAGWGDWAGPGENMMVSQKILDKRAKLITKIQQDGDQKRMNRTDSKGGDKSKLLNVHLSERRVKTASKYKITDIPHPFTSREEYERSLMMPVGEEWNAAPVVKNLTQPEIKTRAGRILEPIKLTKKRKAPDSDAALAAASKRQGAGAGKGKGKAAGGGGGGGKKRQ